MPQSFPAEPSSGSLKWAILLALIIDVPFLATIILAGEQFPPIIILPLAITGLIVGLAYSAGKLTYVLEEDSLRIIYPLAPSRIRYEAIKKAGKVETSLRFRLFGGSLPGAHFGTFSTSNQGNAQAYATKHRGEFILIELSDGAKILINPADPDGLLKALGEKAAFGSPTSGEAVYPEIDKRSTIIQIAVVAAAWITLISWVTSIYSGLPETIPVHFGLDGVPNRYGSKFELVILAAVSALFPTLNTIFVLKYGKYNKGLSIFLTIIFLLAVCLFAVIVNQILQAI
jgi:hypothetical protein